MTALTGTRTEITRPRWTAAFQLVEMWSALAIVAIWAAVLFTAIFGTDIVATSGSGAASTTVPSVVVVALFAFLASGAVAKYGLRRRD